ncbi:MAG: serine/threonine protein kinase [Deltaproteobacteria bacterium]|nr:serine/threonine protein kinase [Deltaproteobacteria bacterium]
MSNAPLDPRLVATLDKAPAPAAANAVTLDAPAARQVTTLSYADTLADGRPLPPAPPPVLSGGTTTTRMRVLPQLEVRGAQPRWHPPAGERFEEKSLLGAGGMGEVLLVHDRDIDRNIAVKRIRADQLHPGSVARFVEEVRTVGRLEHPNIVPIHDVGVDDRGQYFFAMKHVEGETLEQVIGKLAAGDAAYLARFPVTVRVQVFMGVLRAIQYAHAQGIIHRDIKPANIMVGPFGEVVVMDWGLAKRVRGNADDPRDRLQLAETVTRDAWQTVAGTLVGTPAYMSPEQARGDNAAVDERSDIYALGVLFHELLTARHYLDGRSTLEEVLDGAKNVSLPPQHVSPWGRAHAPAELLYFADRATVKDPARRFQSVDQMIDALQVALRGEIHVQCQITATKRVLNEALHFVDRHPSLTSGILTLIGGLIVGSIGWAAAAALGLV